MFENFRNSRLKNYASYLSHYLNTLAFTWVAMLKVIKVDLEFIPDADMYFFFEKPMRGGVCYVSKRYSKSNNNLFETL